MKRRLLIPVLFAAAALAGCMDDVQPVAKDLSSELTFAASSAQTKGIVTGEDLVDATDGSRTLYISAFLHPQSGREDNYFTNEAFTLTDGYWRHDPKIYWPMGGQLDFLAYSAAEPFGTFDGQWGTARWGEPDASARLRLAVGPDRTQDDILFGALYHKTVPAGGGALNMVMNHAQAWIEVTFSKSANVPADTEIIVDDVVLSSVYLRGDFDVENNYGAPERAATWNFRRAWKEDVTVDDINHILGTPLPDEAASVSMLLPEQEMTTLTVAYTMDGAQKTWSQELPHAFWNMGKHYVYAITFDKPQKGDLSLEVTTLPWNTGYEFNTLEEPLLGNVIYGTGDRVDRLGDAFDLSSTSALYWRADGTSQYQILRYEDGTWGSDINTSWEEWEVNIKALGGDQYQLTPKRNLRRAPLTMTVKTPGTLVYKRGTTEFGINPIEYSINRGEWIAVQSTTDGARIPLEAGDEIRLRGDNVRYYYNINGWNRFIADGGLTFDLSGNIMSLIVSDEFSTLEELTTASNFMALFQGNTGVLSARELILPGKSVPNAAYQQMFENCTNMTAAPAVISAESIGPNVFNSMFHGCTSLVLPPDELPATKVPVSGYYRMFRNCSSLIKAPSGLSGVTQIENYGFQAMFEGCTALSENIPERLLAKSIPASAYSQLFKDCKSIIRAPEIDAEEVTAHNAMVQMFQNCASLETPPSKIKVKGLLTETFNGMFSGCSSLTYTPEITVNSVSGSSSCFNMFNGCTNLRTINITWNEENLLTRTCCNMFQNCESLTTAMPQTIRSVAANSCNAMYAGCSALKSASVDIEVDNVPNSAFASLFDGCSALLAAPRLVVEDMTGTSGMQHAFRNCSSMTDASGVSITVASMPYRGMFYTFENCAALLAAPAVTVRGMSESDAMTSVFYNCRSMTDASNVDIEVANITQNGLSSSFQNCSALLAAPRLVVGDITGASGLQRFFSNCSSMTDASQVNITVASVPQNGLYYTFENCSSLLAAPAVTVRGMSGSDAMNSVFYNCSSMTDASGVDIEVANVTQNGLSSAFQDCSALLAAPRLVVGDITGTYGLQQSFLSCSSMTDASQVSITVASVPRNGMYRMFESCSSLLAAPAVVVRGMSGTSAMRSVFYNCQAMTDASGVDIEVSDVLDSGLNAAFQNCAALLAAPHLVVENMTGNDGMQQAFLGCSSMTDASQVSITVASVPRNGMYRMFESCSALLAAPAVTVRGMSGSDALTSVFYGCDSMTDASNVDIEVANVTQNGLSSSFQNCSALLAAPRLVVGDITGTYGLNRSFMNCSSMTDASQVNITVASVPQNGLYYTFLGCSSLLDAPSVLIRGVSGSDALNAMFWNCSSMVNASQVRLEATKLGVNSYRSLYSGCSALQSATMLATDFSAAGCMFEWMKGAPAGGTLTIKSGVTLPSGVSGVPTGWTVVYE